MTKEQQRQFVREISNSISNEICSHICEGKIPPEWNGHELRVLLAEKHAESGRMSCISKDGRSSRARAFRNHCLINGL